MHRLIGIACFAGALFVAAAAVAQPETSVTVYSSADPAGFDPQQFIAQQRQGDHPNFAWQVPGFGVVRQIRSFDLEQGRQSLDFTDVAEFIDPTTVSFTDLTDPEGTAVMEQSFQFDLVSPAKLLEKYVDQRVTLRVMLGDEVELITGKLLSSNQGQLVVRAGDGLRIVSRSDAQVELGELPGGLITRPTLSWLINARRGGEHRVRTAYQTSGMTWKADYNLVLNADDTAADISSWVTLINLSGATYADAKLKLIAGDVQRIKQRRQAPGRARMMMAREAADAGFEEKQFFEYHLYTLPRPTTLEQNATKQIALFPTATGVEIEKVLVYYGMPSGSHWRFASPQTNRQLGNQSNKKVDVYLRFHNDEENNLGMPFPRGKVRVYKQDPADGTLEFVGEDLIDHTPKDERILIRTGQAFDVVGERTQTDFRVDQRANVMVESFEIKLRNHKDEPVDVIVKENLYRWSNWQIIDRSDPYEKIDARTIHFKVNVPRDGEKVVRYTVKYTW